MSNNNITTSLQKTVNFVSTHADLLPLAGVGGYTDEPALTLCNEALSDIFSDPNDYKFNSVDMPMLVTCPNKLDQLFAGSCAFSLGSTSQGWGIDLATNNAITVSGGVVTVTTLENHRFAVGDTIYMIGNTISNYNSTFTDNGSLSQWSNGWVILTIASNSFTFTATAGQTNGDVTGAPGIANWSYLTSASLQEMNNTSSPPNLIGCTTYRQLPRISRVANPEKVAVMMDLGTGVLKIRYNCVPGSVTWGVRMVYQATVPQKTSLSDTWAPIPDQYMALYNQALMYRMYRYLNDDTKMQTEYQKLQQAIMKTQAADDAEATDVSLQPPCLMDNVDFNYGGGWF